MRIQFNIYLRFFLPYQFIIVWYFWPQYEIVPTYGAGRAGGINKPPVEGAME